MTFSSPPSADDVGVMSTDRDLAGLVRSLVGPAIRPQVWLLYLDETDRPLPLVMPFDLDLDCAEPTEIEALAILAHEVAGHIDATQVVVVWEREGRPRPTAAERAVADAVTSCFPRGRTRLRGQFLSHSDGVVRL
ncbi:hypothetical protein [Herbiconiux daphne]|uniref:Uncharacterized protein n=1 Tax=Herbiconiux daphne TaxID=2970914 RepID=A0ABT2H0I2_9MICO|nr:hypothetical protein [Herbiconiux daphne]MCS5733271.1 hypothetical protein [Herbiconiux daphne]